jgi:predicted pyridoxine 5'-phosphate oxidase superfamily flavin-nucleotide-binding protein
MEAARSPARSRCSVKIMATKFLDLTFTDSIREAQEKYYGKARRIEHAPPRDALTDEEIEFIQARDSFYMATISETGWPYLQHRGGKPGFLHALNPSVLAFADYKGNRQLLSTGNVARNERVALFLMDYPQRTRLKILGHARVLDARENPELVAQIAESDVRRVVERVFLIEVISFDWNCSQYITPRYTAAQIQDLVAPLKRRIADLEAQLETTRH